MVGMGGGVVPDVSLGTHFFNDLVESDILYMAVSSGRPGNSLNLAFFEGQENRLARLLPEDARWAGVVRVIDVDRIPGGCRLYLNANCLTQRAVCYLASSPLP